MTYNLNTIPSQICTLQKTGTGGPRDTRILCIYADSLYASSKISSKVADLLV